jgi:hypothetical protein
MHQHHSEKDKKELYKLSKLIEAFTKTGMEMLTESINSRIISKTDLLSFFLFRQTLEMADALSVLIEKGCINASKPLVRTLLECYFQMAYLFDSNEERKTLQFLYHYETRQKEYYERLAFPSKGGSFFEKLKNDKYLKDDDISDEQKSIYAENVKKIEATLNEEGNREIAEEYIRTENKKKNKQTGKKGKISYWFELFDGPKNVEGISVYLNEAALYQFIYRNCSTYAHGEDIVHANLESHDNLSFKISSLRDLRQLSSVNNNILLLIERSCMLFLKNKCIDKKKFVEKFLPIMEEKKKIQQVIT